MPVVRTYACPDCGVRFEYRHDSSDEPYPPCPSCDAEPQWEPQPFAIKSNKSRAVDIMQDIAENDLGMSDMKTNLREGDTAAPSVRQETAAEKEAITQAMSEMVRQQTGQNPQLEPAQQAFWGGGHSPVPDTQRQSIMNVAAAARAATPDKYNPMKILHNGAKQGHIRAPRRVIARAKG